MDISSVRAAALMDILVANQERNHQMMCELAELCGFYRKRVVDVTVGDEIGFGANAWALVVGVEESATPEGHGVILIATENHEHLFGPDEIVDVKAQPALEPF